ncbi:MAG: hypothetical protein ACFFGZ_15090 [Candidatus Thorarchaeota archaeon]
MSGEENTKYWEAVLETIKLVRGLKQYQEEHPELSKSLTDQLDEIIQKAIAKSGGTSSLTQELGLSFISRKPSAYWRAVEDTVRTVRDFILWKEGNPSDTRNLDSFLVEFWGKAEQKVQKASPLAQELGMDFLVSQSPVPPATSIPQAPSTIPPPASTSPPPPVMSPATEPMPTPIEVPKPEPVPTPIEVPRPEPVPGPVTAPRTEAGPTPASPLRSQEVFAPEPEPIPVTEPVTAPPQEEPAVQLSEELLSQLREEEPAPIQESSLTDELLDTPEQEDDDLLSSSLRAALKMLRDEED